MRGLLASAAFAEAVAEIAESIPAVLAALQAELKKGKTASGGLASAIHGRLAFCSINFVEQCSTRVVLVGSNADITVHVRLVAPVPI